MVGNHESQGLRWVTPEQLAELADEAGLVRLARAGLDQLGAFDRAGGLS